MKAKFQLRRDSYSDWISENPILSDGEPGIVTVTQGQVSGIPKAATLIKIGNGSANFNSLDFMSAKAADVYDWAKAATKPTYSASEISGISNISVASATKATQDSAGQTINTTYIKALSVNGRTITYTKGDGTTGTITTQDSNTTYSNFGGATSSAAGSAGLVPAPANGYNNRFLRGDATWQAISLSTLGVNATAAELNYMDGVTSNVQTQLNGKSPTSHTHSVASTSANGFLKQLDNSTSHFMRGDGTWATPPNTTYSNATSSMAGLMSASDKSKLDGIAAGANNYSLPTASRTTLGGVKTTSTITSSSGYTACPIIGGVPYYKDTNTTYTLSSFGITASATELNYTDGVTSNIQTQLNNKLEWTDTNTIKGINARAAGFNNTTTKIGLHLSPYNDTYGVYIGAASSSAGYICLSGTGVYLGYTSGRGATVVDDMDNISCIHVWGEKINTTYYNAVDINASIFRMADCKVSSSSTAKTYDLLDIRGYTNTSAHIYIGYDSSIAVPSNFDIRIGKSSSTSLRTSVYLSGMLYIGISSYDSIYLGNSASTIQIGTSSTGTITMGSSNSSIDIRSDDLDIYSSSTSAVGRLRIGSHNFNKSGNNGQTWVAIGTDIDDTFVEIGTNENSSSDGGHVLIHDLQDPSSDRDAALYAYVKQSEWSTSFNPGNGTLTIIIKKFGPVCCLIINGAASFSNNHGTITSFTVPSAFRPLSDVSFSNVEVTSGNVYDKGDRFTLGTDGRLSYTLAAAGQLERNCSCAYISNI